MSPLARSFELTIGLPSEPNVDLVPLLHLDRSGLLRTGEITARLVWGQSGAEALPDLLAGRVQAALFDVPVAASAAERKIDLAGVFQLYPRDPSAVFGLARTALRTAADLGRQRIGLPGPLATPKLALTATLKQAGLTLSQVDLVSRSGDLVQALQSGAVAAAAASSSLITWLEARSLRTTRFPSGGWELVPGPAMVMTRAFIAENRAAARALVMALQAGVLRMLERQDELQASAQQILAPEAEQRPALAAQVEQVLGWLRSFPPDRGPGWADPDAFDAAGAFLRDLGALDGSVPLATVFVNDLLPRAAPPSPVPRP